MKRSKEDFIQVMNEKTDGELLEIVEKNASDYTPEALSAAKDILTERGISYKEAQPEMMSAPSCFAEKYYAYEKRFLEYLIDYFSILILCFVAQNVLASFDINVTENFSLYLLCFIVIFLYYFILETKYGKTIGKMILGMKVVDANGNKPTKGRIALRTICRFIPFEALSFLGSECWKKDGGFSGNWHDGLSETYVVNLKAVEEDMKASKN